MKFKVPKVLIEIHTAVYSFGEFSVYFWKMINLIIVVYIITNLVPNPNWVFEVSLVTLMLSYMYYTLIDFFNDVGETK